MRRGERLRTQAIPRALWLAGDGFVHAQRPVLAHAGLVKALLGCCLLAALWVGGYLAWLARSFLSR
jgi:hypothetical protein